MRRVPDFAVMAALVAWIEQPLVRWSKRLA